MKRASWLQVKKYAILKVLKEADRPLDVKELSHFTGYEIKDLLGVINKLITGDFLNKYKYGGITKYEYNWKSPSKLNYFEKALDVKERWSPPWDVESASTSESEKVK